MNKDKNKKSITDSILFFREGDLFKKKENIYLLHIFGLSFFLFFIVSNFFATVDSIISYFLSLISSVLIINGYNAVKKENNQ